MARSRRIFGNGAKPPEGRGTGSGGLKRTKRISPSSVCQPFKAASGIGGKVAGKDREFLVAVEMALADRFAGQRVSDDAGKPLAAPSRFAFAGCAYGGERQHLHLGARIFGPCHRPAGELGEDRLEPVMAVMMEVIGLGGGQHDAVDARPEQARPQAVRSGSETFEDLGHGAFEVGDGGLPAIQRREHVDEHDLAV